MILYHASCPDGFCAAWVAHRRMPDAEFIPVQYGQDPPDVTGREVYILDFSYKRPAMEAMRKVARMLTVLDHHKTAQAELAGFGETPPNQETNVRCVFDLSKSGGRLTWEMFFRNQAAPWLVDYTEDRDLWAWKLAASREVSAAIASLPRTFEEWDRLNNLMTPLDTLAREGAAILRYQAQLVEAHVAHAVEQAIDGHQVLTVNATCLMSEIGEKLAQGRPFGATYFIREDDKKVWSLRSREGGIDVSEVAKRHGGGGHRQAAGFEE